MQPFECIKAEPLELGVQEAASLAEAMERWLDDGGEPDNETASELGVGDFSSLQLLKP